jgi:hypothetical protein
MVSTRKSLMFAGVTAFLAGVALFGQATAKKGSLASPKNRPWPAPVQKVSDEQPVLSPADAIKTFWMPATISNWWLAIQ